VKFSQRMFVTPRAVARLATLAVLIACVSACSASMSTSDSVSDVASAATIEAGSGFRLVADVIGGDSFSLDGALAEQPVALWFWAPG